MPFILMTHSMPITTFYQEWLAGALGLISMLAFLGNRNFKIIHIPKISFIFVGLAGIICAQWALGMLHSSQYAQLVLSYFLWAFLLTILGSHLKRTLGWEKIATTISWFFILGGIANVGIVSLQIAVNCGINIPYLPATDSYGAMAQSNHFADYISLTIGSLFYLFAKDKIGRFHFGGLLVLFTTLLAFSGSRSSWFYLVAITILAASLKMFAPSSEHAKKLRATCIWLLPLFAAIQIMLHLVLPDYLIDLPTEEIIKQASEKSPTLRMQIWLDSFYIFTQSPWLGIGTGQLRWQSYLLLDSSVTVQVNKVYEHAHNIFLHLAVEMGLLAPMLLLAGLIIWLKKFSMCAPDIEKWWCIALLSVIGIHSMLEYPLWFSFFLGITAFLFGAADENIKTITFENRGYQTLRMTFVGVVLVGAMNLTTMFVAYYKIEYWLIKTMQTKINPSEVNEYTKTLTWIHNHTLLAPYAEFTLAITTDLNLINSKNIEAKLWLNKSALNFAPNNITAYKQAILLLINGNYDAAALALKRALLAFPEKQEVITSYVPSEDLDEFRDLLQDVEKQIALLPQR
ncbi:MAG TPA: Wzy polymerase domain-containing protein [Methylotenera sp.]|nr:Wzy polymerase domain-containing protein [Methylotenera sp.]